MRVLGISGSLRSESHNSQLLSAVGSLFPEGVELVEYRRLRDLPHFDQDDEHDLPLAVRDLHAEINAADAVLIVTPEYNSSLPGVLKNALDWGSRPYEANPLRNKPVAVLGASTNDYGAMWARADAKRILGRIGARVIDQEHGLPNAQLNLSDLGLDESSEHRDALQEVVDALVQTAMPREAVA
jgi:chromate reductase, NAD(P)H dehydrogenase (quinone)